MPARRRRDAGIESGIGPPVKQMILADCVRLERRDEVARLRDAQVVEVERDAEFEQLLADPAVLAKQGMGFIAIDPRERGEYEALLRVHVRQNTVLKLGPHNTRINIVRFERQEHALEQLVQMTMVLDHE